MKQISLKKPKIQKFLGLTAFHTVLPNLAFSFGASLIANLGAAIFLGPSEIITRSLLIGFAAPVLLLTARDLFNYKSNYKINRFFKPNDHYFHNLYKVLKTTNEEILGLTGAEKDKYLLQRKAQLVILNKENGVGIVAKKADFNEKHKALFKIWEQNQGEKFKPSVETPEDTYLHLLMLEAWQDKKIENYLYKQVLEDMKNNPLLADAVAQELQSQNITPLDLAFDLYQNWKEFDASKEKRAVNDHYQDTLATIKELTQLYFSKGYSLSSKDSKATISILQKIKDPDTLRSYVDVLVNSLQNKNQFDTSLFQPFIHKTKIFSYDKARAIIDKISNLSTLDNTQSSTTLNPGERSSTVEVKNLFQPSLLALLSPIHLQTVWNSLQIEEAHKKQLDTVFTDIRGLLEQFEKSAHLMSSDKAVELKVLAQQNVPLLLDYLQEISVLQPAEQKLHTTKIVEISHQLENNIQSFQGYLSNNLGKKIDAFQIHMNQKEQELTAGVKPQYMKAKQ